MPEESKKYGHKVCVAGINESGEWRRLYPFQFAYGGKDIDFRKKDVIEAELAEPENDKRRESRKVVSYRSLEKRMEDADVIKRIRPLVSSIGRLDESGASLGVVKPEIVDFKVEVHDTSVVDEQKYLSLWSEELLETREKVKLPIEASYLFMCGGSGCRCSKKPHDIKIIDWELNELARNVMKTTDDRKEIAQKIKDKFFTWMKSRDVYFFLGTHFRFGTWMIVGIFYPERGISEQKTLLG